MKRQFLIARTGTLLALAGTAAVAIAGTSGALDTYGAMDDNDDGSVSKSEFQEFFLDTSIYESWDSNDSGWLGENEFAEGMYDYYDDDHNGYVTDAEWEDGIAVDDYGDNGFWDI